MNCLLLLNLFTGQRVPGPSSTRREPIPGGSSAASLPQTVADGPGTLWPFGIREVFQLVLFVVMFGLLASCSTTTQGQTSRPLILTSLAPVYQLSLPLLADTDIQLRLLPDSPRSMQNHAALFVRQAERFEADFRAADAVISMGQVWLGDPLYVSARQVNIRVVNIDAGKPFSHELDGVAVANSPVTGESSPYVWLSPSNVLRMLDNIAGDLQRLYPADAPTIKRNLDVTKSEWISLKADVERRLLEVDDPQVYALADEFIYLASDLGLFVAGWFVKQDLDWTEADYRQLTQTLQDGQIGVVIHKWEPAAPIQAAIAAAGAQLVVLDTLEASLDFARGFRMNLDDLLQTLFMQ